MSRNTPTPIFDNAVDSLSHGIQDYLICKEFPPAIKYAILNIHHSIELFLKEQLARIHPILIYRNIDKKISDDSLTVGLAETLIRLENLGLGLSANQIKILTELQKRRNRIEHHRFDIAADHELAVGQALKFLLDYLPQYLEVSLEDIVEETDTYRTILQAVLTYEERLEKAVEEARLEGVQAIVCPQCGEDTLAVSSLRGDYCFLCHEDFLVEPCEQCGQYAPTEQLDSVGICTKCADNVYKKL
jgi:hypothetical protein